MSVVVNGFLRMLQALLAPVHSEDKKRILNAIELLGPRVTPELIALETGMPLLTAVRQLNLVAAETQAHLEVDSSGRICYRFAPNFASSYVFDLTKNLFYSQGKFTVKLFKLGIRLIVGLTVIVARIAFSLLWFLFRISFGVILVGSILMIIFGLFALLSNSDGDALGGLGDLGGASAEAGSTAGGALLESSASWGPNLGECFVDLLRCFEFTTYLNWWSPYHSGYFYDDSWNSHSYSRPSQVQPAGTLVTAAVNSKQTTETKSSDFFMDFFSFIFGDGDPNLNMEDKQWQYVGRVIEKNNGVVIAEQVAPYMSKLGGKDEDWMLSVLVHFNGAPDVSDTGNIVYVFPSFVKELLPAPDSSSKAQQDSEQLRNLYHSHVRRQTVTAIHEKAHLPQYLMERNLVFSLAESHATYLNTFLIALNLLGSIWFFSASSSMRLLQNFHGLSLFMLVFAIIISVLPALRAVALIFINSRIDKRNSLRMRLGNFVSKPDETLRAKLAEAEQACETLALELHSEVIYKTDSDYVDQEFANLSTRH